MRYKKRNQSGDYFHWLEKKNQKAQRKILWVTLSFLTMALFLCVSATPQMELTIPFLNRIQSEFINNNVPYLRVNHSLLATNPSQPTDSFLVFPFQSKLSGSTRPKIEAIELEAGSKKGAFVLDSFDQDSRVGRLLQHNAPSEQISTRCIIIAPGDKLLLNFEKPIKIKEIQIKSLGSDPDSENIPLKIVNLTLGEQTHAQWKDLEASGPSRSLELSTNGESDSFLIEMDAHSKNLVMIEKLFALNSSHFSATIININQLKGDFKNSLPETSRWIESHFSNHFVTQQILPLNHFNSISKSRSLASILVSNSSFESSFLNVWLNQPKEGQKSNLPQTHNGTARELHYQDLLYFPSTKALSGGPKSTDYRLNWYDFFLPDSDIESTWLSRPSHLKSIPFWISRIFLTTHFGLFSYQNYTRELNRQLDMTLVSLLEKTPISHKQLLIFTNQNNGNPVLQRAIKENEHLESSNHPLHFSSGWIASNHIPLDFESTSSKITHESQFFGSSIELISEGTIYGGSTLNKNLKLYPSKTASGWVFVKDRENWLNLPTNTSNVDFDGHFTDHTWDDMTKNASQNIKNLKELIPPDFYNLQFKLQNQKQNVEIKIEIKDLLCNCSSTNQEIPSFEEFEECKLFITPENGLFDQNCTLKSTESFDNSTAEVWLSVESKSNIPQRILFGTQLIFKDTQIQNYKMAFRDFVIGAPYLSSHLQAPGELDVIARLTFNENTTYPPSLYSMVEGQQK